MYILFMSTILRNVSIVNSGQRLIVVTIMLFGVYFGREASNYEIKS